MGWTEMQFYLCTPAFFFTAYDGFVEQEQIEWERARYVSFHAIHPLKGHVERNKWKINSPSDLGAFAWEKKKAKKNVPRLTPEEYKRISDELDAMLAKQYNMSVTTPEA